MVRKTRDEVIEELQLRPDGEWTKAYVGFLRVMRPTWKDLPDNELIAKTLLMLQGKRPSN